MEDENLLGRESDPNFSLFIRIRNVLIYSSIIPRTINKRSISFSCILLCKKIRIGAYGGACIFAKRRNCHYS